MGWTRWWLASVGLALTWGLLVALVPLWLGISWGGGAVNRGVLAGCLMLGVTVSTALSRRGRRTGRSE
ncbi:hypothetical protein AB0I22_39000 [Streptomyces sp. NPDC050610]|uniref:hypothetical protein n=1 Tax=Streptomyces sp. NPDC050610 TaxID=3157097 RepID=UPI00343EF419